MRKFLTVLAAPLMVAATTALIAGCSSKPAGGPLPEAAPLVKEAQTTTVSVKSAHLTISVTGQIKSLPVKTLEGDLTNQPATAAKGSAKITMLGADVDVKFVVLGGDLYGAISGDDYQNFGLASDIYDVAAILDPNKGLANVLAEMTDPESVAHETINGQKTVKITGEVPADAVNKLAPQLKANVPTPCAVWIQEGGDHELVQAQLTPSPGNSIQMTLSNWNAPVSVEKPAGV